MYDNNLLGASSDLANRVYPFTSYFELAARFSTSENTIGSAWEELRRLYGWMASRDPSVTFWEGIGANGRPYEDGFTSMAHGCQYSLLLRPPSPRVFQLPALRSGADLKFV